MFFIILNCRVSAQPFQMRPVHQKDFPNAAFPHSDSGPAIRNLYGNLPNKEEKLVVLLFLRFTQKQKNNRKSPLLFRNTAPDLFPISGPDPDIRRRNREAGNPSRPAPDNRGDIFQSGLFQQRRHRMDRLSGEAGF